MLDWTTEAAVKAYLGLDPADTFDDIHLSAAVLGVNSWLDDLPPRGLVDDGGLPKPHATLAATMLAGRLYSRRNSPQGVANFAELGAAYVSRYDPDIERQLRIGGARMPAVG